MIMDKNETALLELVKSSLFDLPPHFPEGIDWQKVLDEAKVQTVVALAVGAVPKEVSADWEICAGQSQAHFMRVLYEQTKLVELLQGEGIPFVIIKGSAAAIYYPKPNTRTMGDIDLLVTEDRFETAFSLLENNEYKFKYDLGNNRECAFSKGGIVVELHRRYSDVKYNIEEHLINGIKNARTVTLYGNSFPALPEPENALVLLDHIRHHLWDGLGLRQFVDFMMCVSSVKDEKTFKSEFLPLFEEAGLGTFARVITKMCKKYLGLQANAEWCDNADDETCKELLETMLKSGNFGRKQPHEDRPVRNITMSIKSEGFFKTLQRSGLKNGTIFEKYRFLRPFAWIYQLFRYIYKGIVVICRGETVVRDVSFGKEKADLYKRLGIK